eukprot:534967_1
MSHTASPHGKTKKSYANCPPIQLVLRTQKGWSLYKQHHKTGKLQIQSATKPCTDADIIFSSDGAYFAVLLEEGIEIYESYGGRQLTFLKHYRVRNVYFSPLNNFIVSYHHRRVDDKHGNCWVWKWGHHASSDAKDRKKDTHDTEQNDDTANKEDIKVVYQFYLPEFDKKRVPLQFTNDEVIAARITQNGVLIHEVKRLHYKSNNIIGKLDVPKAASVVVAPCKRPKDGNTSGTNESQQPNAYILAVFAMPKNNKAATVTVYEYQYSLAMNKRSNATKLFTKISQRAFYGVDQCELLWDPTNSYHHNLLAIASSDVDTSGKSYYGNQTLFLLSSRNNNTVKIPISDKGKLQDVKWSSSGKEFVMIDDHPQKITVFDYRGNNISNLGQYARNLIRFSNDGRFLWCGGFGNLTGEMTFYDYKNIKENPNKSCLGYNTDDACRYFEWSPDSSTFVTARLYPYMTVDNGFRIYKYNGQRLFEETFDRLYQIRYRPSLKFVYPQRSPSPNAQRKAKSLPKPQAKKRYVPPHLRKSTPKGKGDTKGAKKPQPQPKQTPNPKPQSASGAPTQRQNPPPPHPPQQTGGYQGQTPQNTAYTQQNSYYGQPQQQQQQQQQRGGYQGRGRAPPPPHANRGGFEPHARQPRQPPPQPPQGYGQQPNNAPQYAQQQRQSNNYYGQAQQQQQQRGGYQGHGGYYTQSGQGGRGGARGGYNSGYYQGKPSQPPSHGQEPQPQVDSLQNQFNGMNVGGSNGNAASHVNGDGSSQVESGGQAGGQDAIGADPTKKKKKRKRSRNKKQNAPNNAVGGNAPNNASSSSSSGGFKPGLHDNKRWARGSKYTE